ncbi:MAG: RNA polymerase sigma factor [Gemmatimonadetes bacterium]|nr:RNA polymerase sigma factor [Gemmatimonadota bacterium]
MDDQQLIAAVRGGDPRAEREFYDRFVDRVYRLAHRLAGDAAAAQDYTQETFVRAFDRLAQFRGEASLSTWICRICVSVTLNGIKARTSRGRIEVTMDEPPEVPTTRREAEPDLKTRLHAAIDALPDGYRTVFVMHDVEGYTHEEIGQALEIQPGTSKAQLFRARAKLRTALADFAGEWA